MKTRFQPPSRKRSPAGLLLYDARCGLCRQSVAWLTARDFDRILDCRPLQDAALLAQYGVLADAALSALHAVEFREDGDRIYVGADAVFWAVSRLPGYRWTRHLLNVPPIRRLARIAYREAARRRKRDDGCECIVDNEPRRIRRKGA